MTRTIWIVAATLCGTSVFFGCSGSRGGGGSEYERRLAEGRTLAREGQLREAAEAFEDATYAHPDGAEGHYLLAKALLELGQGYRAADELRRAEELRQDHGPQKVLLGRVLVEVGRLEEAEEVLVDVVARWPEEAEAHYALGLLRLGQERLDDAERSVSHALRLDKTLRGVYETSGRLALRQGRTEQAVAHFETATKLAPTSDLAHGGHGAALVVSGQPGQAQSVFREAITRAGSKNAVPWRAGLALAYAADGRWEPALDELTKADSFFDAETLAAFQDRLVAGMEGWQTVGCRAHEQVCQQANQKLWAGALLLFVLGAADGAEREIRASLNLYDGDALSGWVLAYALYELGRQDEALMEMDRSRAWEPSPGVLVAMEALTRRIDPSLIPQEAPQPEEQ